MVLGGKTGSRARWTKPSLVLILSNLFLFSVSNELTQAELGSTFCPPPPPFRFCCHRTRRPSPPPPKSPLPGIWRRERPSWGSLRPAQPLSRSRNITVAPSPPPWSPPWSGVGSGTRPWRRPPEHSVPTFFALFYEHQYGQQLLTSDTVTPPPSSVWKSALFFPRLTNSPPECTAEVFLYDFFCMKAAEEEAGSAVAELVVPPSRRALPTAVTQRRLRLLACSCRSCVCSIFFPRLFWQRHRCRVKRLANGRWTNGSLLSRCYLCIDRSAVSGWFLTAFFSTRTGCGVRVCVCV